MDVIPTSLAGLWKIVVARARDERGWFLRTFDGAGFAAHDLPTAWSQQAEAFNDRAGTLRGLHFQREPHGEAKLIHCTRGSVYDVLVDVRAASPTYGRWEGFTLSEEDDTLLFAAAGLAHGYQTLRDESVLHYLLAAPYVPAAATGYRYDSPRLGISWPLPPIRISAADRALPAFEP